MSHTTKTTTRTIKYDHQGRVIEETTVEETKVDNDPAEWWKGYWGTPQPTTVPTFPATPSPYYGWTSNKTGSGYTVTYGPQATTPDEGGTAGKDDE